MTIVTLPDNRPYGFPKLICDATSLRLLLAGRWAIFFSHPDDFAQEQLETDRWVSVLNHSFRSRGVVPVALAAAAPAMEQGWLSRLAALDGKSAIGLTLDSPALGTVADLSAGALRADIARCGPRFAMVVDSNLRCRRALTYRPAADLPSPLDLIGWAVALRKRDQIESTLVQVPTPPISGGRSGRSGHCAHGHSFVTPPRPILRPCVEQYGLVSHRGSGAGADGGMSVGGLSPSSVQDSRERRPPFTCYGTHAHPCASC